jgi:hypothetical protein
MTGPTGTTYTFSASSWYRLKIQLNSNATSVTFVIYDDAGNVLWTDSLTTNIPTSSGRETGAGMIGTSSGTTAVDLYHLDLMALAWGSNRTR